MEKEYARFPFRRKAVRWLLATVLALGTLFAAGCRVSEEDAYRARTEPLSVDSWRYSDFEGRDQYAPRNFDPRTGANAYRNDNTPQFGPDVR